MLGLVAIASVEALASSLHIDTIHTVSTRHAVGIPQDTSVTCKIDVSGQSQAGVQLATSFGAGGGGANWWAQSVVLSLSGSLPPRTHVHLNMTSISANGRLFLKAEATDLAPPDHLDFRDGYHANAAQAACPMQHCQVQDVSAMVPGATAPPCGWAAGTTQPMMTQPVSQWAPALFINITSLLVNPNSSMVKLYLLPASGESTEFWNSELSIGKVELALLQA